MAKPRKWDSMTTLERSWYIMARNEEWKARRKAYYQTPEYKARQKARRQTPEYKASHKARQKSYEKSLLSQSTARKMMQALSAAQELIKAITPTETTPWIKN